MQTIHELRAQLAHHNRQANHLLSEKGSRAWSAQDQAAFDTQMEAAERLQRQITALQASADDDTRRSFNKPTTERVGAHRAKAKHYAGLDAFLRRSSDEWSAQDQANVSNTMSTTTGSEGGFTVAPSVTSDLIDILKDFGAVRRVATRVVTDTGADMGWPSTDGRSEVGEIVANNQQPLSVDPVFASAPLNTFKFGSKIFTVPVELLQDSSFDVVGFVLNRSRDRIGRAQNLAFTTGAGGGSGPAGLTTAAPIGRAGATGDVGLSALNYELFVDLVDTLDVAYHTPAVTDPNGPVTATGWMFNQSVRKSLRKIKDPSGRPIWSPGYEAGMTAGSPDKLLGYTVNLNNDMPSPAANAISVAFGNFGRYVVRDAMEMMLRRFDDAAYATKGQVGFLAWARAGGNLIDQGSVITYKHSAS